MHALFAVVLLSAFAWTETRAQKCSGSATYQVTNDCTWTAGTHPTDYPSNAHFSPMCGTVHNAQYTLFAAGSMSTPGVKLMAETGSCSTLKMEVEECAEQGKCGADGYFRQPCSAFSGVCTHSFTVTATASYPYISMTTMIAPSPDWFVGFSNVNLCVEQSPGVFNWAAQYPEGGPRALFPYDAGTDSGVSFQSPNMVTSPVGTITRFDAMDATNIFYNQVDRVLLPLCQVKLTRVG